MASGDKRSEPNIDAIIQIAGEIASDDVRDGYTHSGPAASGAFRFKWIARQQTDGRFIVDETVGGGSAAVSSRPMFKEEVVAYIGARQRRIQAKVDEIKRELAGLQGFVEEPRRETAPGVPPPLPQQQQPPQPPQPQQQPQPQPPLLEERDPMQMYDAIRRMLKEGK
jgi:hypothetical protein